MIKLVKHIFINIEKLFIEVLNFITLKLRECVKIKKYISLKYIYNKYTKYIFCPTAPIIIKLPPMPYVTFDAPI